jgi:hypothetical protein
MGKVEVQRAMRDARFAAYRASLTSVGGPPPAPATETKPAGDAREADSVGTSEATAVSVQPPADVALCGHRSSIGNKSCIRPSGHPQTSHRYS